MNLTHMPTWASPLAQLCGYCASDGREHRPDLDPAEQQPGHCRCCGDELESMTCRPDQACESPHTACGGCGRKPVACSECFGIGAEVGCVFCHGTDLALEPHCCHCGSDEPGNCGH